MSYATGDTPFEIAMTPEQIIDMAENYEKMYGFFARNKLLYECKWAHENKVDWMMPNSREVNEELRKRGIDFVASEEQFIALVKEHGLPLGLQNDKAYAKYADEH